MQHFIKDANFYEFVIVLVCFMINFQFRHLVASQIPVDKKQYMYESDSILYYYPSRNNFLICIRFFFSFCWKRYQKLLKKTLKNDEEVIWCIQKIMNLGSDINFPIVFRKWNKHNGRCFICFFLILLFLQLLHHFSTLFEHFIFHSL